MAFAASNFLMEELAKENELTSRLLEWVDRGVMTHQEALQVLSPSTSLSVANEILLSAATRSTHWGNTAKEMHQLQLQYDQAHDE